MLARLLAFLIVLAPTPVLAQGVGGVTAGEGPIDIEADTLEVFDEEQRAVFSGNVRVLRGETTMTASELVVFYAGSAATGTQGPGRGADASANQDIERIEATGPVTISTPEQTAEGDEAVYDVATETVVMTGDVVLTQGENVLRGPRLTVNLITNEAKLDGAEPGTRVRATFQPSGN